MQILGNLLDIDGTLYGTSVNGGTYEAGSVFKLTVSGVRSELYSFRDNGADGKGPENGLVYANGVLYGTTGGGGAYGAGTVFGVTLSGREHVICSFSSPAQGFFNPSGLVEANGTLYGTAVFGGTRGRGAVFSVTPGGVYTVLHSFGRFQRDGAWPQAALLLVGRTLYGTTTGGVNSTHGTVFRINTDGSGYAILHTFGGAPDGAAPVASLIDVNGTLYGTTSEDGKYFKGTMFSLVPFHQETVLHSFGGPADGRKPLSNLVERDGVLYGTTASGPGASVDGTIYSVTPSGSEAVLHDFTDTDGTPWSNAMVDVNGTLFGETENSIYKLVP